MSFHFGGGCEPVRLRNGATVQLVWEIRSDSAKPEQRLLVDFVPSHQIGVVAEVRQEPVELPKCLWGAVEPTSEGMLLPLFRFADVERRT